MKLRMLLCEGMLVIKYITMLVLFSFAHTFTMHLREKVDCRAMYWRTIAATIELDKEAARKYPSVANPLPSNDWFKAAFAGNFNLCLDFINNGRKIDETDAHGWNALLWAAKGGHHNLCRLFLKQAVLKNRAIKVLLMSLKRLIKEGDRQAFVLYENRNKLIIPHMINHRVSISSLLRAIVEIESIEFPSMGKCCLDGEPAYPPYTVKKPKKAYDFLSMAILDPDQLKSTEASLCRLIEAKKAPVQNSGDLCTSCLKAEAKQRCGGCKKVYYCDAQCQRSHWPKHKPTCNS